MNNPVDANLVIKYLTDQIGRYAKDLAILQARIEQLQSRVHDDEQK